MTFDIAPCEQPPAMLREACFAAQPEPQIHYLEQRAQAGRSWRLGDWAYATIHDGAVVEFFARDEGLPVLNEAFEALAAAGGATSAVIKTYDALALAAVAGRPARVATIGINSTSWSDETFDPPAGFSHRPGDAGDRALVAAIGPGLFETPDDIGPHLAAGGIVIYALAEEPVGCGVLSPVREGADTYDLGVGVLPGWRRRGVGEQIIRHLKVHCLRELGVRPVCGCAVENTASRRTLERAGFETRHRLLEFRWDG